MFFRGPAGHVQADLTQDRQRRVGVDAIDPRQIDSRLVFEERLGVERDAAFAVRLLACGRQVGAGARGGAVGERLQVLFDPRVALRDQTLHRPVQLARLLQREEVLDPPRPDQRLGDRRLVVMTTFVPQCSQLQRIAFAAQDRVDDQHPRHARDVRQHAVQLEIHLRQRLLHVLIERTCSRQ